GPQAVNVIERKSRVCDRPLSGFTSEAHFAARRPAALGIIRLPDPDDRRPVTQCPGHAILQHGEWASNMGWRNMSQGSAAALGQPSFLTSPSIFCFCKDGNGAGVITKVGIIDVTYQLGL